MIVDRLLSATARAAGWSRRCSSRSWRCWRSRPSCCRRQGAHVAAKILVFVLLVGQLRLLLGYTGIVSFAHTMFFGIGAYGVAIACTRLEPSWGAILVGVVCALVLSGLLALAIGLFSLRVRAIFFAMITLAVAGAFQTAASQLSESRGRGRPELQGARGAAASFSLSEDPFLGASLDGRFFTYYLAVRLDGVLFLVMLRIVNSPFGRVLQAIRENDFRAESLGYRTVVYRTLSTCWRRCSRRWPACCSRSGCATTGPTPRCRSRSCSTSC